MRKLFVVIKREYVERVRTKWFVIVTLFGPLFFAAIMVLPAYLSVRGIRGARVGTIHILDATGVRLGERIADQLMLPPQGGALSPAAAARAEVLADAPRPTVEVLDHSVLATREGALLSLVQSRALSGYLVVDSLTRERGMARYASRNAGSVGEQELLQASIRSALLALRVEAAGISPETAAALSRTRVTLSTERITDEGRGGSGLASVFFGFGVAILLYMSIIFYGQAILRGVLEEKTTRVAEVILSSVRPDTLLAGKVIGVGAVGLTQQLLWLVSSVFFWTQRGRLLGAMGIEGMPPVTFPSVEPMVLVALVLFFLLGYTLYAAMFAAVGAMVGSQEEAQQAAQPVMMLLVFSIIFAQPVMMNPTGRLAEVVSWIPFSAPIIMPMRMTATEIAAPEIVAVLAGVALACVACIWASARIYRIGLLMYGKRPNLRELLRWVGRA